MANQLLVATRNNGKIDEYSELICDLSVDWLGLEEINLPLEVEETGATFLENAILKATKFATASGLLTLADDSGLEVDALDGKPGVHTARYGGEGLTPIERYKLLLKRMEGVPTISRTARFRCVIALASPDGLIGTTEGVCEGRIADSPAGSGGFGYDPVFYLPERKKTMAELASNEKHQISHRGRAIRKMTPLLSRVLGEAASSS